MGKVESGCISTNSGLSLSNLPIIVLLHCLCTAPGSCHSQALPSTERYAPAEAGALHGVDHATLSPCTAQHSTAQHRCCLLHN
jgi:hypothetical protein